MKKILKSRILLVIVTVILTGSISVYAAHKYYANEVTYKETTLDQALDTLYAKVKDDYTGSTTITPSTSTQTLSTNNKILNSDITINPIPSKYKDTSSSTVSANSILSGYQAYNSDGQLITGNVSVTDCITGTVKVNSSATTSTGQTFINFVPSKLIWILSTKEYDINISNGINKNPTQYTINLNNKTVDIWTNTSLMYTSSGVKFYNATTTDIGESWNYIACK